jgi:cytosine/adenosine deaminase-related metal-dependent hydrolase
MRFISADMIYPISSNPLEKAVIVVDDNGVIKDIVDSGAVDITKIEHHKGSICPGFVNTHCHLELSYMRGKIPGGGGLHHFIQEVEKLKKPADEEVEQAIRAADAEMQRNGIVAVGDISNTTDTFKFKNSSPIYYHTFIEIYAFDEKKADAAFERGVRMQNELSDKKRSSITPHAPYSASRKLLKYFSDYAEKNHSILTLHNQETPDEDLFFQEKRGSILDRLNYFGVDTSTWIAPGTSSLNYTLPQLPSKNKLLLVHNTFTSQEDIDFANSYNPNIYWCFCPNANLYIENELPNFHSFIDKNCRITLGTDSYASNWELSIFNEIKTLYERFPKTKFEMYLTWGTLNGAKFLGIDDKYGSIEKGKKPGLNLINPELSGVTKLV